MQHRLAPTAFLLLAACASVGTSDAPLPPPTSLGHFSVSLAVQDLAASRAFYEKLGFRAVAGAAEQGWLILQCGDATVGIFQGVLERNGLTFNPGWDARGERLESFEDVRAIQRRLERQGLTLSTRTDPEGAGPAYITLVDPDGNPVLIDQHVE